MRPDLYSRIQNTHERLGKLLSFPDSAEGCVPQARRVRWWEPSLIRSRRIVMKHLALLTFGVLTAATARGEDFEKAKLDNWHHWRGPLANGSAPNADPPIEWGESKNIK